MNYKVKYQAGTYSGVYEVWAEDEEEAIEKTKRWVRRQMFAPMYYESYRIID